ncbi:MAG TPA: helix-turn-helix domain-containing protein [Chloroflexota bacterium]|nr:helix-turn-helix domain-containing protein [Chloroflexota bacterium]
MTNQGNGWLTIREAALQLGVSELTIRRRIKDGKVAHRLENGKYYINFDLPVSTAHGAAEARSPSRPTAASISPSGRAQIAPTDRVPETNPVDGRALQANRDGATVPTGDNVAEPSVATQSSPPRPRTGEGVGGEGPHLNLDALLGEHRRLAEQVGRGSLLAERVRELEAREAQLQESLVALSNRNGWLESKLEEREREVKLLTDGNRRVSWWRRLFGAPATG